MRNTNMGTMNIYTEFKEINLRFEDFFYFLCQLHSLTIVKINIFFIFDFDYFLPLIYIEGALDSGLAEFIVI